MFSAFLSESWVGMGLWTPFFLLSSLFQLAKGFAHLTKVLRLFLLFLTGGALVNGKFIFPNHICSDFVLP